MESKDRLFQIFSKNIRGVLENLDADSEGMEEIRMRVGAPLIFIYRNKEYEVRKSVIRKEDVEETLQCAVRYSLYAYEEELRQGFLTVQGGHRIGTAGRVVLENGRIKTISPVTFLNVRFSHQIRGCADEVLPYLFDEKTGGFFHTLILSPPRCGKTTLLRDIIRQVSEGSETGDGASEAGKPMAGVSAGSVSDGSGLDGSVVGGVGRRRGLTVGLVDERSEIAACYQGIPQNEVGRRTDVLDCCPKAVGMMMLIRSMAPEVVAVDEIGGEADLEALRYVMNCGCRILATVHGTSMDDVRKKPGLSRFLEEKGFERYLVLGNERGPGTLRGIWDGAGNALCGRSRSCG